MHDTKRELNPQVGRIKGLDITRLTHVAQLKPFKTQWNLLAKNNTTRSVFQTYEWHDSWWKTFGNRYKGLILIAQTPSGKLVGIAPLMVSNKRIVLIRQRVVEFIGASQDSDYCDFIVDPDHPNVLGAFVDWLLFYRRQWDVLCFSDIPGTSSHLCLLEKKLAKSAYHTQKTCLYEAPTCIFYDRKKISKIPRKKSLKRHFNYFNRMGSLKVIHCSSYHEIERHFPRFFKQHISRRALSGGTSQFEDDRQKNFFKTMAKALVPTGWLCFSIVFFNGRPIAYHLGFIFGGRFIWYKPTFDVTLKKHSPGEVLIKYLFEYALEQGVEEFDFTIGGHGFKYRFANHIRYNFEISLFRYGLPHYLQKFYRGVKQMIKSNPIIEKKARQIYMKIFRTS